MPTAHGGKLRDAGMPLDIRTLYDEETLAREVAKRLAAASSTTKADTGPGADTREGGAR